MLLPNKRCGDNEGTHRGKHVYVIKSQYNKRTEKSWLIIEHYKVHSCITSCVLFHAL